MTSEPIPLRLVLELVSGADPIEGRVRREPDGRAVAFAGWTGLAVALEEQMGDGSPAREPTDPTT